MATIRHATVEDVPTILHLIRELAIYEHALDSVAATPELLISNLSFYSPSTQSFTPGHAKTLLLSPSPDTTPVAFALYYPTFSTWTGCPGLYLEDLMVLEEHRGKGYGKMLISRLAEEVVAMGGKRLEWSCLKWNESSLGFYEGWCGAERMEGWVGLRVEGEGLGRLAWGGGC